MSYIMALILAWNLIKLSVKREHTNSVNRKDAMMKKLLKKLETIYSAVAFAESGEFDTAREIMNEDQVQKRDRKTKKKRPRRQMQAPGIKR